MSAQIVGAKLTRRIARETGLNVVRAWSHGGYDMAFVTADHQHGAWSKRDGSWELDPQPHHYTSCSQLFPEPSPKPA